MPSSATITAYYTFQANTKARATQVNANFSLYRGHNIPIEPLTATGSDISYDLGSTEYRWRTAYAQNLDLVSSTLTSGLQIRGFTGTTAGAFGFYIANTLAAQITTQGFNGAYMVPASVPPTALTQAPKIILFDTSGSFVIPTGVTQVIFEGCGGGGGGAGGAGTAGGTFGGGGGGGGGAPYHSILVQVMAGETITCSLGGGGSGGAGGGAGVNVTGTAGSTGSTTTITGTFGTIRFAGGTGGTGGTPGGAGGAGATASIRGGGVTTAGGTGATQQSTTGGTDGEFSPFVAGGAFNSSYGSATTGGGGGGGGSSLGAGGQGGRAGASGIANPTDGAAGAQGGGGGGGGGGANGSGGATGGAGASGRVRGYYVAFA